MKYEALRHQGTSCQVGTKSRTDEIIAENTDDSARQIQRYIRLTNLIPELLDLMDEGKIAFSVGVELSYLSPEIQRDLFTIIERDDHTPSYSQAYRLHKAFNSCSLTKEGLELVMSEEKANQRETLKIPMDKVRKYAPRATDNQLEDFVLKACDYYQRYLKRQRDRER
jgi:ParB family chromosome partitioning protein